jgi:hypothetical protein
MTGEHRAEIEAEIRRRGIAITSFGQPGAEQQIADAERQLGHALPAALRRLYRAFDGFCGPANAAFLWPLFGDDGLVRRNLFGRSQRWAPSWHGQVILFGDNGVGDYRGIPCDRPDRRHGMAPYRRGSILDRGTFDSRRLGEGTAAIRQGRETGRSFVSRFDGIYLDPTMCAPRDHRSSPPRIRSRAGDGAAALDSRFRGNDNQRVLRAKPFSEALPRRKLRPLVAALCPAYQQ